MSMTVARKLGIFVGGASSRMGGTPKGLLAVDDTGETIVARLLGLARELGLEPLFVGQAEPYAQRWPDVRCIADDPAGVGPLGGLSGLLTAAGDEPVIVLACDMPFVSPALLARLQTSAPEASVLASKTDGRWDPLCARYDPKQVRPVLDRALASGVRSFQRLFTDLTVTELVLDASERAELADWDTPEDVGR